MPIAAAGRRSLLGAAAALLLPAGAAAKTPRVIHIDADRGRDEHPGTREAPLRSLGELWRRELKPGDVVALKAGGIWREEFWWPASGSENRPILLTRYGAGPKPRVTGSDRVSGFRRHRGSVCVAAHEGVPLDLYADRRRLQRRPNAADGVRPGEWDASGGRLFVNTGRDASTQIIEERRRESCITAVDASHIGILGVELGEAAWGLRCNPKTGWRSGLRLRRCTIRNTWAFGVQLWHDRFGSADFEITDNEIFDVVGSGIGVARSADRGLIARNRVYRCATAAKSQTGDDEHGFTAGIQVFGANSEPTTGHVTNVLIEDNRVSACGWQGLDPENGLGIWVDECDGGNAVRRNRVKDCSGTGICAENSPLGGEISCNIVHNCGRLAIRGGGFGIFLSRGVQDWLCAHNIVHGCHAGIVLANYLGKGFATRGNRIINNISVACNTQNLRVVRAGDGTANQVSNNCLGHERPGFVHWTPQGTPQDLSSYAELEAVGLRPGIARDPLFFDAAAADFRPLASSPCRRAGTATAVRHDITGTVFGSPPDIGAYAKPV